MTDFKQKMRELDIKHYRWMVEHYRYRQQWPRKFVAFWFVYAVSQIAFAVVFPLWIGGWSGVGVGALFVWTTVFAIYELRIDINYINESRATELDYRQKLIDMGVEV
jgi:hypothetical protein